MRLAPVVLAVVLLVAGCNAPAGSNATSPSTTVSSTPPTTDGVTTDRTAERRTSAANPWGKETLTVAVANTASPWRNVTRLVEESLAYWEVHDEEYAAYEVSFEIRSNASDPDVIVRYVDDISVCGSQRYDKGAGFASRISESNPPDPPEAICVRAGYSEAGTRRIIDHEFGHLLGIGHGEQPLPLMNPDYEYLRIPQPNRAVREFSPPRQPLTVYTDYEQLNPQQEFHAHHQLDGVLAYYEGGAAGSVDENVTFARTENRSAADVVVTFPSRSACDTDLWGTCADVVNRSDGQPQLEIALTGVHENTYGWHVGFWLGYAMDVERHSELAPPFRNATFEDRLSRWWEPDTTDSGS